MIYVFNPPAAWLNNLLLNGLNSLSGSNIMLLDSYWSYDGN